MNVRVKIAVAASCLLFALTACASNRVVGPSLPAQPPLGAMIPEDEVGTGTRVAVLLPLTGAAAAVGQDMLQAAEMALFDAGENDVVLLPRDTGGTPEGATLAVEQALAEQADLILGPLFSQAVQAITPITQAAGVPVIAFSNDAAAAAEGVYLLGFRPEEQVERVVRYALAQGLNRIAGLAPDDPYGATALQALNQAVVQGGGTLGPTAYYPADLSDPSAVVRQVAAYDQRAAALEQQRGALAGRGDEASRAELQQLESRDTAGRPPFDAILIADVGDRLRSVASLLTFYDVDPSSVRFLGTMRWQDDPRVLQEAALQGGWFAAAPPDSVNAFQDRFQQVFGNRPQPLAELAYDAAALAVIISRDLADPQFSAATLTNPQGFLGATGLFRIRPDGLAEHGLAILEANAQGSRVIDPAPQTFVGQIAIQ